MDKNKMNISQIEDFFYSLLYGKLTKNLFFTSLPNAIKSDWNEMVLVDVSTAIEDLWGYGKGMIAIYSYATPMSNGNKNTAELLKMDDKLNELIENSKDSNYYISRYKTYTDYDTERNLHCNVTLVNIKIV